MKVVEEYPNARITHEFEEMTREKRPQDDPARNGKGLRFLTLEPIHKVVESEESVVIPSLAPASLLRGAECGSLNTAVLWTAMVCATRVI
jgi:hypothetical protein